MNEYINITTPPTDFENSTYAVFWIERTDTTEIGASYSIPLTSSIPASYTILPSNRMYTTFEMLSPPRIDEYLMPTQDAMIRSDRQTMNFGHNELGIGYSSSNGAIIRSLMKWDLSDILPPRLILTEAKLTLKFIDTYQDMNFVINKIESYWQEYTTTWKSQPIKGGLVGQYTAIDGQMVLQIDVLDLVKEWYGNPSGNYGILLQALDEALDIDKRFGSKEMEGFEPNLHIQYIDPVIPVFERATLESNIRIAKHLEKELIASIEINSIYRSSDLPSNVKIHMPDTLESSIEIERNSIEGSLTIWSNSDIPASINIPEIYDINLDSNLNIAKLYLDSNIEIVSGNTLISSLSISNTEENVLNGNLSISKSYISSEIFITQSESLLSNIDIFSTVTPSVNILSKIQIAVPSEKSLSSSITIHRIIKEENLQAEGGITRRVLPSGLTITGSKIMIGIIRIIVYEQKDLLSNITISRCELPSSIKIVKNIDMPASVRIPNNSSIMGTLFIPHYGNNQIEGDIFILSNRFIPAKMFIRSPYLRANIRLANKSTEILNSSIILRDIYPYLEGEISIASPNSEDLLAQITIKNPLNNDERAYWFIV